MDLSIDQARKDYPESGIFVRAKDSGVWGSHDITHLDKTSLREWLKSRDDVEWPIRVVEILLGHK